tara:strand:+ start:633 stop:806 length:174 start_codon:yes stop_codon:yes gene_type:complete
MSINCTPSQQACVEWSTFEESSQRETGAEARVQETWEKAGIEKEWAQAKVEEAFDWK